MIKYKFRSELLMFNDSLWGPHVIVPQDLVHSLSQDGDKRVVCTINDSEPIHRAMMSDGKGQWFLMFNKEFLKENNLHVGDAVNVVLWKDHSEYGMPMPEEMTELLYQDPEGSDLFHSLTKGKQRSLLYLIAKPKSSDIRLRKALVVIDHLKIVQGKLDFKKLNEAMKESRG